MSVNFKTMTTQDTGLNQIQANVRDLSNRIQQGPFFNGNVISSALTSGQDNSIAHGLGFQPSSWILLDQNANSVVWRVSWDTSHINLHASANCNIRFWVS